MPKRRVAKPGKQYSDPRLHRDTDTRGGKKTVRKPGSFSGTSKARPDTRSEGGNKTYGGAGKTYGKPKPAGQGAGKPAGAGTYKKYEGKKYEGKKYEGQGSTAGKKDEKSGAAPKNRTSYTYMRTLAESSTGAKGGSFQRKNTLSPGKKKVILKKRRAEIKFHKKQGKVSFDLKRLTLKSFDEAGLPEVVSPVKLFTDFALHQILQNNIAKKGLVNPTPIQGLTIPEILKGRDVIGIANTGTGKTAAFTLPIVEKLLKNKNTRVLIMAPTRELAEQIEREVKTFVVGLPIRTALCIGGRFIDEQMRKLGNAPQFVIGTPGRLMDLERRKRIQFNSFNVVILDEMDRMLDMGFLKDIKEILLKIPRERQTLLFSATMPKLIQELARQFLTDPLEFTVKPRATSRNVEQEMVKIKKGEEKIERLHAILLDPDYYKVIIFGRTKRGVDHLEKELTARGFKVDAIHGDKTQNKRSRAIKSFTRDEVNILVATDVAARGLDIPDVTHVINYDIPETYDDYVHRIGRTGRGDKSGKAITFVRHDEM
jgi:superfamily II DNA/RNA helicase